MKNIENSYWSDYGYFDGIPSHEIPFLRRFLQNQKTILKEVIREKTSKVGSKLSEKDKFIIKNALSWSVDLWKTILPEKKEDVLRLNQKTIKSRCEDCRKNYCYAHTTENLPVVDADLYLVNLNRYAFPYKSEDVYNEIKNSYSKIFLRKTDFILRALICKESFEDSTGLQLFTSCGAIKSQRKENDRR